MIRTKKEPAGWGTAPAEACLVHRGEEEGREGNETGGGNVREEEETAGRRKKREGDKERGLFLSWGVRPGLLLMNST